MNLNAYDIMTPTFTTTWIVPRNKKLYSDVIPYYKFYTFLKRYNNKTKEYDYYIVFSNDTTNNCIWYRTYLTKSKSIKVDLSPIWTSSKFNKFSDNQEIDIEVDDKADNAIIYHFNI